MRNTDVSIVAVSFGKVGGVQLESVSRTRKWAPLIIRNEAGELESYYSFDFSVKLGKGKKFVFNYNSFYKYLLFFLN